jgi:hypothetical protein
MEYVIELSSSGGSLLQRLKLKFRIELYLKLWTEGAVV